MEKKIVITGAAGLVGQNLVVLLRELGYENLVAVDKHRENLAVLENLNPGVKVVVADLAERGDWSAEFEGADCVAQLHAQITSKYPDEFVRNNIHATEHVIDAIREHKVPFCVHVSSSVVNSVADDDYTWTKRKQEEMVKASGLAFCALRPTLMFGWFDPKHLGWLARFMKKAPVFPIPGNGKYLRQPLYNRDFCRAIEWCIRNRPNGAIYDIVGQEDIYYIDIIRTIRRKTGLRTPVVRIPVWFFAGLMDIYGLFSSKPPFTSAQLKALAAGDYFSGVNVRATFGFEPTPFEKAIEETFCDPRYSSIALKR